MPTLKGLKVGSVAILDFAAGLPIWNRDESATMNDKEAIAVAKVGGRVAGKFSIHEEAKPDVCPGFNCQWRTLFCDGETDVVECYKCGRQDTARCNFDEEYA